MLKLPSNLVSIEWLLANAKDPDLIILDASIKKVTGSGNAEPSSVGIPGSLFFDLENKFSDTNGDFPNTFPSAKQFQDEARELGVNNRSAVVVYDDKGIYSSPRAWYLFKAFGHDNVAVLDGGLPEWKNNDYKVEPRNDDKVALGDFTASYHPERMRFFKEVELDVLQKKSKILDARSAGRFNGTEPEPRAGLRSGTIPGSKSLPFSDLMINGKMKSAKEIREIFINLNASHNSMIFSCGSGITACVLALGAEISDIHNYSVYDGSWTEWGSLRPE